MKLCGAWKWSQKVEETQQNYLFSLRARWSGRHLLLFPSLGAERTCSCGRACTRITKAPGPGRANVYRPSAKWYLLYLRFRGILSYLLVQSGRPDLFDASAAYLANQHSKHRDHVVNYGTRDTISTTARLFVCSVALSCCNRQPCLREYRKLV